MKVGKPNRMILLSVLITTILISNIMISQCINCETQKILLSKEKGIDTIFFGNESKLIIEIPEKYGKAVFPYEEGIIVIYYTEDKVYIKILIGALANLSRDTCYVTDRMFFDGYLNQIKGYCLDELRNEKKYFRLLDMYKLGFEISYENVRYENLEKYDKMIDNLKYIQRKS